MTDIFTAEHLAEAEKHPNLGPTYFAARDVAEKFMAAFEAEHFKSLIDKAADDFRYQLWTSLQDSLLSDTESNLQLSMRGMVDATVDALLGGNRWALERYALGPKHDCDKVRAAVAALVPKELQDARIADLEAEVASLKQSLEWARR